MPLERIKMTPQRDPGDHGGVSPQAPVQDTPMLIRMIHFVLSVCELSTSIGKSQSEILPQTDSVASRRMSWDILKGTL